MPLIVQLQGAPIEGVTKDFHTARGFTLWPHFIGMPFQAQWPAQTGNRGDAFRQFAGGLPQGGVVVGKNGEA